MTIKITFVPAWAANVVKARGADFKDTLATLSQHDLKHFLLANHLFKGKLIQMGISADEFTSIADGWKDTYTESDVLFALYGTSKEEHTVANWTVDRFASYAEPGVGYTVVEMPSADPKDFLYDYLTQLDTLEGHQAPLESSAFTCLLTRHVNSLG